ncbi:MAG: hypothetical protein IPN18_03025 [Ignavibacteriales bacterium]|nr:hypothetical protein [Ignavibacteriales bacterium]
MKFTTIQEGFSNPAKIYNNILLSIFETYIDNNSWGIEAGPDTIKNNLLTGNFGVAIRTNGTSTYRDVFNNHISGEDFMVFSAKPLEI